MTAVTELRTDYALRGAISEARLLVQEKNKNARPEYVLLKLAELIKPAYCFVLLPEAKQENLLICFSLELDSFADDSFIENSLDKTEQAIPASNYSLRISHVKNNWKELTASIFWSQFIANKAAVVCSEPLSQAQLAVFPVKLDKVQSALLLPIYDGAKFVGVMALVNPLIPFKGGDARRAQLLMSAFVFDKKVFKSKIFSPLIFEKELLNLTSKNSISDILIASFDPIIILDKNYLITAFNNAAKLVFGIKNADAIGLSINGFIFIRRNENISTLFDKDLFSSASRTPILWKGVTGKLQNGKRILMNLAFIMSDLGATLILQDISSKLELARKNKENLARFKTLTNLAPVGIIQVDRFWCCTYANEEWHRLTRLTSDEILGLGWTKPFHEKEAISFLDELKESLEKNRFFIKEFCLKNSFGQSTWVKVNARALYDQCENIQGFLGTMMDITSQRTTENQLRRISEYDVLTGLVSRSFFETQLTAALENTYRTGQIAVLFIDLDGFKAINDTLGHDNGDELLKFAAVRIKAAVRSEDIASRFGGDEFTVMLGDLLDNACIIKVAQMIVNCLARPFIIAGKEVFVTASIGIACNEPACSAVLLIKHADLALYHAKHLGRNNFQFFTPQLDLAATSRMKVTNRLHRALERNEFKLCYQPLFNIKSNKIIGFEALLRWQPFDLDEAMLIEHVILLLEESSLIDEVGFWVLQTACEQFSAWLQAGYLNADGALENNQTISVNVSAKQLIDPRFCGYVFSVLHKARLAPHYLVLEITETALMKSTEHSREVLEKLRNHGIKIALDDFGVGYSSLGYLRSFTIDYIKIDRSFVSELAKPVDAAIIKAIVEMAKGLGLLFVAEGVDSKEKLDQLFALGCEICQGYYFSVPLDAEQIVAQLFLGKA